MIKYASTAWSKYSLPGLWLKCQWWPVLALTTIHHLDTTNRESLVRISKERPLGLPTNVKIKHSLNVQIWRNSKVYTFFRTFGGPMGMFHLVGSSYDIVRPMFLKIQRNSNLKRTYGYDVHKTFLFHPNVRWEPCTLLWMTTPHNLEVEDSSYL